MQVQATRIRDPWLAKARLVQMKRRRRKRTIEIFHGHSLKRKRNFTSTSQRSVYLRVYFLRKSRLSQDEIKRLKLLWTRLTPPVHLHRPHERQQPTTQTACLQIVEPERIIRILPPLPVWVQLPQPNLECRVCRACQALEALCLASGSVV